MELLEECAREKAGMGQDWEPYAFRCLPEHPQKIELIEVTGAVAPLKTRGGDKGERDWSKKDKATKRTVYITFKENAEFVQNWERSNGKCAACKGTGQAWCGWSAADGNRFRECTKCDATGKPKTQTNETP